MFGKKKPQEKGAVCQQCGLDCGDKSSLARHIDWAHQAGKSLAKQN
jgi:uncharacterized membrane protein YvbJ